MSYSKTKNEETIQKTIRIPKTTYNKIQEEADKYERDISKQIIFMLKKYLEISGSIK